MQVLPRGRTRAGRAVPTLAGVPSTRGLSADPMSRRVQHGSTGHPDSLAEPESTSASNELGHDREPRSGKSVTRSRLDQRLQIGHLSLSGVSVGAVRVADMAARAQDPGRDDRERRIGALVARSVGANIQPSLPRGTEVEVLSHYQNHWVTGFEIDGVHDDRYLLRRCSDNTVLPAAFRTDRVRVLVPSSQPFAV